MPMLSALCLGVSTCTTTTSAAQRTAPAMVRMERAGMSPHYMRRQAHAAGTAWRHRHADLLRPGAAGELRAEVTQRELVAWRRHDEVVAPAALHEGVDDARGPGHVLDLEVEAARELVDALAVGRHVVPPGVDQHDARVVLE